MNIVAKRVAFFVLILVCTCTTISYTNEFFDVKNARISFLDVGQGDSIFITTPSGKQLLVDSGRSSNVVGLLEEHIPYFDSTIDVVVGTHPDADHIGGMPGVLEKYAVDAFFEPGSTSDSKIYNSLQTSISEKKIPHIYARKDMVIDFGDDSYFVFLFPNQDVSSWETNNSSIVGVYIYKDTSFLLTGDAPIATEMYLVQTMKGLHADILKLGHHGSRTSSGSDFLEFIHPGLAIISAGKGNLYGHPHQEVLERLEKLKIPFFSTVDKGTITLSTNGKTIYME